MLFAVRKIDYARIASQAEGEQILVSSLLKALLESSGGFEFGGGREMESSHLTAVYLEVG